MKSHPDFVKLNEYLDKQLNKDEIEVVRAHLENCERCRRELEEITALRVLLTEDLGEVLQAIPPQSGWFERLVDRYRRDRTRRQRSRWAWTTNPRYLQAIALGAVALLLVVLYLPLEDRVPLPEPDQAEKFVAPESLPSPEKELRMFGLDQRGEPDLEMVEPDRVKVFSSDDPAEVERIFTALQEANLRPIRRGKEILVERINQTEAQAVIDQITRQEGKK